MILKPVKFLSDYKVKIVSMLNNFLFCGVYEFICYFSGFSIYLVGSFSKWL